MVINNNNIKLSIYKFLTILSIIVISLSIKVSYSQDTTKPDTSENDEYFLQKKKKYDPVEVIKGDTLQSDTSNEDTQIMPGGKVEYSESQDSAYRKALEYRIPIRSKIRIALEETTDEWEIRQQLLRESPWASARENLAAIPEEYLKPSGADIVHYQEMIRRGMYAPHITNIAPGGLKVPLGTVYSFLGLKEDVSPEIKFTLKRSQKVEIVIYSVNAAVVATLYDGYIPAGSHKITWNLRDDEGRPMPKGDYIAEVRMGEDQYVRKRIVIK